MGLDYKRGLLPTTNGIRLEFEIEIPSPSVSIWNLFLLTDKMTSSEIVPEMKGSARKSSLGMLTW